jgi:hypothetical protein
MNKDFTAFQNNGSIVSCQKIVSFVRGYSTVTMLTFDQVCHLVTELYS